MIKHLVWVIFCLMNFSRLYSQSLEINGGLFNVFEQVPSEPEKERLYKQQDNFIDVRFVKEFGKRKHFCIGLMNSSDNFVIYTWNTWYPKSRIDYTNRLTTLYGGLRWQFPLFKSKFWLANQLNFGLNFYRIEKKQYLQPGETDFSEPTTSPYFLEVIHKSHLKANLRYEVLFAYNITSKLSANFNISMQLVPSETDYKFTTNTSTYGDYFEDFFGSKEYINHQAHYSYRYQLGIGIQYRLFP